MSLDHLLPRPKHITRTSGAFTIDAETRIVVPATSSDSLIASAHGLQLALADFLGITLAIVPSDDIPESDAITLVSTDTLSLTWTDDEFERQAFTLEIATTGVVTQAASDVGLFYGVQTLIQIARLSGRQWPG